jgi:hypothetical protein
MDWKYKRFYQERVFASPREVVLEAARSYMTESLGWKITDTAEGLRAEGYSFSHGAIANFRIQTVAEGTRVAVELLVERAGWRGFMLFDVGGYYGIQIRHWLDGIQWFIHQKLTGQTESQSPPAPVENKTTACLFNGCLMFIVAMFALWAVVTVICALVGLITGNLYLWGRGGTLVIHGTLARIVSALIILGAAWIGWQVRKKR